MKKINVSSKLSFIISSVTSIIFVSYFAYKGFKVYFVQKAMDDTFVGGSSSDITITLWFAISGVMALSMFLFFQFTKIKDLNSQITIQKGIFFGWTVITIAMIAFIPSYIYFILLTIIGFLTFIKKNQITILIMYLISLSIVLEILHLIIPGRSFQWSDLFGNLAGVIVVIFIKNLINKYEDFKK